MGLMNLVVYISNWQVHRPALIVPVASSDWDCGFITAEDDKDDQRAMHIWIFCNNIL